MSVTYDHSLIISKHSEARLFSWTNMNKCRGSCGILGVGKFRYIGHIWNHRQYDMQMNAFSLTMP